MHVELSGSGDRVTTMHSPIAGLGSWTTDGWLAGFKGRPQFGMAGGFVYVLGGYLSASQSNQMTAEAWGAPLLPSGSVGQAFSTTAIPAARGFGQAVEVDDWLFLVGGKPAIFGASGVAEVDSAQVGASGQLSAWSAQPSLPQGRTNGQATLGGDFIYVTGGGYSAGGLDTVFAARARF
jgi:hypothetical protein